MKIRILLVDDSNYIRVILVQLLNTLPEIECVYTARNGIEAIKILEQQEIDVILLDFFMPKMDGIETLEYIMKNHPIPTLMITMADQISNADLYFKALQLGAIDIICKPSGSKSLYLDDIKEELFEKIKSAVLVKARPKLTKKDQEDPEKNLVYPTKRFSNKINLPSFSLVIIGASTGGPSKVIDIVSNTIFRPNIALIVVLHMPAGITSNYTKRLDSVSNYRFHEITNGMKIEPQNGYVVPGDYHMILKENNSQIVCELNQNERVMGVRPSIDYVMESAAFIFQSNCVGIILTGMGKDGTRGINEIKVHQGITFVQDPNEALISSMPNEAIKTGMVDYVLKTQDIVNQLNIII